jgi:hypothetical protein
VEQTPGRSHPTAAAISLRPCTVALFHNNLQARPQAKPNERSSRCWEFSCLFASPLQIIKKEGRKEKYVKRKEKQKKTKKKNKKITKKNKKEMKKINFLRAYPGQINFRGSWLLLLGPSSTSPPPPSRPKPYPTPPPSLPARRPNTRPFLPYSFLFLFLHHITNQLLSILISSPYFLTSQFIAWHRRCLKERTKIGIERGGREIHKRSFPGYSRFRTCLSPSLPPRGAVHPLVFASAVNAIRKHCQRISI